MKYFSSQFLMQHFDHCARRDYPSSAAPDKARPTGGGTQQRAASLIPSAGRGDMPNARRPIRRDDHPPPSSDSVTPQLSPARLLAPLRQAGPQGLAVGADGQVIVDGAVDILLLPTIPALGELHHGCPPPAHAPPVMQGLTGTSSLEVISCPFGVGTRKSLAYNLRISS